MAGKPIRLSQFTQGTSAWVREQVEQTVQQACTFTFAVQLEAVLPSNIDPALERVNRLFSEESLAEFAYQFLQEKLAKWVEEEWNKLSFGEHLPRQGYVKPKSESIQASYSLFADGADELEGGDEDWNTRASRKSTSLGMVNEGELEENARRELRSDRWDAERMLEGFQDLLQRVVEVRKTKSGAVLGPWDEVLDLYLPSYMPAWYGRTRRQDFSILFYGAEFGTGVAENVGPSWVRTEGPTKAEEPKLAGAWWYGPRTGEGHLMLGQRGLHFFYDRETRELNPRFHQFIRENMRGALRDYIRRRL